MNSGDRLSADKNALVPLDELGRRLTRVLDRLGTRRNAATVADRSVDQLAKYEKGIVEPPFSGIARLCLKAGVRMEWLATGEEPMLASDLPMLKEPETAPYKDSVPAPGGPMDREMNLLTDAIRIAGEVLTRFGLRERTTATQFAEVARFVYAELARGAAEDAASAALDHILELGRTPR